MISLAVMPYLRRGFLRVAGIFSLLLLSAASLALNLSDCLSLAAGLAAGTGDNFIMLTGIEASARKGGVRAFAGMKKNMLKRTAFAGLALLLAIEARANVLVFFLAFMLIHCGCLVFFIITAQSGDESPACGKELNNGSRESNN